MRIQNGFRIKHPHPDRLKEGVAVTRDGHMRIQIGFKMNDSSQDPLFDFH